MEANIYRRFPLELQRYRKHFGSLLCPCPRWISILWFFLGDTGWKISPKWQELPTCAIYFSPWPSGLLRPGKTSGKKIISHWTLIISIILESESSDRVKHVFCIYRVDFFYWSALKKCLNFSHFYGGPVKTITLYILFQIFYDIMHWQIEIQGISQKVFWHTL